MTKFLIMSAGLPGVGKSFFINKLKKFLPDYEYVNHTDIRRELKFDSVDTTGKKDRVVLDEANKRTYDALKKEKGVIIDSVHRHRNLRKERYEIAAKAEKKVLIIEFICSKEESLKRIKSRPENEGGLVSDTWEKEVYDRLAKEWESIGEDFHNDEMEHVSYIKIDTENLEIEKIKVSSEATIIVELIEELGYNRGVRQNDNSFK